MFNFKVTFLDLLMLHLLLLFLKVNRLEFWRLMLDDLH